MALGLARRYGIVATGGSDRSDVHTMTWSGFHASHRLVAGLSLGTSGFAAKVVEHLEPVLAPRGFPPQGHGEDDSSVLFHCDGPDVGAALQRYPSWRQPLAASYGSQPIPCLDLWVQQDGDTRSWSLEIFTGDVAAAAGPDAMRRLEQLQDGSVEDWVAQLADVLEIYFTQLETERGHPPA